MIGLQNSLDFQKLCQLATKKIKSYFHTKNPTEDQIKDIKEK